MDAVAQFKPRPRVVDAIQFTRDNRDAVQEFVGVIGEFRHNDITGPHFEVLTRFSEKRADVGDWIVRYSPRYFDVLRDKDFHGKYVEA